jgi:hypothetical protein
MSISRSFILKLVQLRTLHSAAAYLNIFFPPLQLYFVYFVYPSWQLANKSIYVTPASDLGLDLDLRPLIAIILLFLLVFTVYAVHLW